jgi:hypothetical protein
MQEQDCKDAQEILSLYSNKKLTIASGATPIGSACHALDVEKFSTIMDE